MSLTIWPNIRTSTILSYFVFYFIYLNVSLFDIGIFIINNILKEFLNLYSPRVVSTFSRVLLTHNIFSVFTLSEVLSVLSLLPKHTYVIPLSTFDRLRSLRLSVLDYHLLSSVKKIFTKVLPVQSLYV